MFQINFGQRPSEELEGKWGLVPDPMGRCRQQGWWKSQRKPGFFFPSYDDDAFWPTQVPGVYNISHPNLEYYEGDVIYLLHFPAAPARKGERVYLSFEGVADRCQIYLNGHLVGEHDGPYTPFPVEVTNRLARENRLLIIVTCQRQADTLPGRMHDWFHYGGIHGPVRLYRVPQVFVQDVAFQTKLLPGDRVRLHLGVRLYGPTRDNLHPVQARLEDAKGKVVASWQIDARAKTWAGRDIELSRSDVRLWDTGDPYLYRLVVECSSDRWEDEVGLRQIEAQGTRLLLNGEELFLRGVCNWNHDPASGLMSTRAETAEKVIALGRELSINFFRACHIPPSLEFIRACDRAGILVWAEIPAYWMSLNMVTPGAMFRAYSMGQEMLCALRNSPSIIFWSLGNECCFHDTETPHTNLAYFLGMAEFFHAHDPSRLVTYTGGMEGTVSPHINKICPPELVEQLDVVGINVYSGMNDGAVEGAREEVGDIGLCIEAANSFGKPMILAENGISGVPGETSFDFGEDRQETYYKKVWAIVDKLRREGKIQGVSYWVLSDYRTAIKFFRKKPGYCLEGLVTHDLQPKKAFHVVAKAYKEVASEQI